MLVTARATSMSRQDSSEFEELFDRINRQLEEASRRWGGSATALTSAGGQASVDVVDRGDEFVVTMDLPGYTTDAVTARLTDRTLFVDAEREGVEETEAEGDEEYLRMERSHESISRRVRLPEAVDADDVAAQMNNGVLTVTVGKETPGTGGRAIDID